MEDDGGMAKARDRNSSSIDPTLMSYRTQPGKPTAKAVGVCQELRECKRVVVTYGPTTHTAFSQIHSGESV